MGVSVESRRGFDVAAPHFAHFNITHWTAVAVLVVPMEYQSGCRVLPPYQLVKKIIQSWDQFKLSNHFMDLT